jgi:hypothetical protein
MKNTRFKLAFALALSIILGLTVSRWGHSFSFGDGGEVDFRKIDLISPVGGDVLGAGTTQSINWQVSSKIDYLTIEYSVNNGDDWIVVVKSLRVDSPADYYRWQVPCNLSDTAKIKLTDTYGPDYDTSLEPFSIVDATPPSIKLAVLKNSLSPANGEMLNVGLSFAVEDNCDPNPEIFLKITSDEPTTTNGDSAFAPDARVSGGKQVLLRAERSGDGDGRVYVIALTAADASGNSSAATVAVRVNLTKDREATDTGQFYDATSVN